MQFFGSELALWLNVGVQIFLCISGYLYGQHEIEDGINFLKKQFLKILIPYYVTIIPVLIIHMIFNVTDITIVEVFKILLCKDTLDGGGHLWFIPLILMCYCLTPFLYHYYEHYKNHFIVATISMMGLIFVVFSVFINFFSPAWITCYMIGFAMGFCNRSYLNAKQIIIENAVMSMCLFNVVQMILDYGIRVTFDGMINSGYILFCNYNHVWLGITIYIVLHRVFSKCNVLNTALIKKGLKISDKYSYMAYLVHQFLILGPLSLMRITENTMLNILIIVFLIGILTKAVWNVSNTIAKLFMIGRKKI